MKPAFPFPPSQEWVARPTVPHSVPVGIFLFGRWVLGEGLAVSPQSGGPCRGRGQVPPCRPHPRSVREHRSQQGFCLHLNQTPRPPDCVGTCAMGCMPQPPSQILGPWLRGALFTTQAQLPPRPPFGSGAAWCLHFADLEKSDSSTATRKLGPVKCHPVFKRQPGLELAEECQEHCAHSGGGWMTKTGTRVDYAPGPRLAEVKAQGWG